MAEDATDYGIKYRKQGDSEWIRVAAQTTRAARTEFTVSLTGLEPNTTYEYAAYASGYDDGEIQTITTESVFVIPNSSMEEWGEYQASTLLGTKTVKFPGTERNFWDSGNAGAAAANDILTEPSSVMINSGATSVKLTSKECGLLGIGSDPLPPAPRQSFPYHFPAPPDLPPQMYIPLLYPQMSAVCLRERKSCSGWRPPPKHRNDMPLRFHSPCLPGS